MATSSSWTCPKLAAEITAGKTFGSVESVKAVSDLYAPASGTVTEVNADLATAPEKINKDAHGSWMVEDDVEESGRVELIAFRRRLRKVRCRRGRALERLNH